MRRRLLNLLTAGSLLMCVAVCALWVRSYVVGDTFWWMTFAGHGPWAEWHMNTVHSGRGGIGLRRWTQSAQVDLAAARSRIEKSIGSRRPPLHRTDTPTYPATMFGRADDAVLGFMFKRYALRPSPGLVQDDTYVVLPLW